MIAPPTTAWDLRYEHGARAQWTVHPPGLERTVLESLYTARPDTPASGWSGTDGPGIAADSWPRSPESGLPMRHALTVRLPSEYLCHGPDFPGIAVFQGDVEQGGEHIAGDLSSEDPFLADLARCRAHPQLVTAVTRFDQRRFALVWLTARELAVGPTPPPPDTRGSTHPPNPGPNAWDNPRELRKVWLSARQDPNVGLSISPKLRGTGYRDARDPDSGELRPWATTPRFQFANHLGGTYMPIDFVPNLSPFFLQLSNTAGLELGTSYARNGILAVDLANGIFDHIA